MTALTPGGSYNSAMHLPARPGTHLAVSAPPHISPKGGAQGARPSSSEERRVGEACDEGGPPARSAANISRGRIGRFYSADTPAGRDRPRPHAEATQEPSPG